MNEPINRMMKLANEDPCIFLEFITNNHYLDSRIDRLDLLNANLLDMFHGKMHYILCDTESHFYVNTELFWRRSNNLSTQSADFFPYLGSFDIEKIKTVAQFKIFDSSVNIWLLNLSYNPIDLCPRETVFTSYFYVCKTMSTHAVFNTLFTEMVKFFKKFITRNRKDELFECNFISVPT
ncbi:hypothetical protein AGLY_006107 [Aphis glycines]|uniref:Uncharacterized protein n=1 Tax=Aphis glycines TaxID=307491 RepID=A0A6G0TSW2_APHGL|nr:hypothetical protein AGLY_006107 [Aphis glycines]